MGCCCGVTYEEEVELAIINYLKTIKKPDSQKNMILKEIKEDLLKRASTVNRYYYPYRGEDVEKTVNYYKNYILMKMKGFITLYEVKRMDENKRPTEGKNTETKTNEIPKGWSSEFVDFINETEK